MAEVALETHLDKFQALPKSNLVKDNKIDDIEKTEKLEVPTNEKLGTLTNEMPHNPIMEAEKWEDKSAKEWEMVSEESQFSTQNMPIPLEQEKETQSSTQNLPTPLEQEHDKLQETLASQTTPLTQSSNVDDAHQSDGYEDLQNQAYSSMEEGYYEEATAYFDQAIQLKHDEFSLFYNKACCHAKLEQIELAIAALQQAIFLNTECLEMAINDSDFDKIRNDTRFQSLL
jgi:tetratricopeptide (TPR) repeat protein